MAYTTIDDPSAFFQTALYTGNGTAIGSGGLTITNDGNSDLKPDWIWHKKRGGSESGAFADSSRGTHKGIFPNETNAESSGGSQYVNSFNTDGFTVGNVGWANDNSNTYVAWQWKANGGTLTTNDASATSVGTHDSQYQANTTAGFSIVTWTGNAEQETLAHGLGAIPEMIWIKNRSDSEGWWVGVTPAGNMSDGKYLLLNTNDGTATNSTSFVNQNPTSTVFRVGGSNSTADNAINGNSDNMIAYCFTSIQGYSKFGSFEGNGNADGPFVYTGFKPAWVMVKNNGGSENWALHDSKRSPANGNKAELFPNIDSTESVGNVRFDLLSNGFKVRQGSATAINDNGDTIVYFAFAEHPFASSKGVPATAR